MKRRWEHSEEQRKLMKGLRMCSQRGSNPAGGHLPVGRGQAPGEASSPPLHAGRGVLHKAKLKLYQLHLFKTLYRLLVSM